MKIQTDLVIYLAVKCMKVCTTQHFFLVSMVHDTKSEINVLFTSCLMTFLCNFLFISIKSGTIKLVFATFVTEYHIHSHEFCRPILTTNPSSKSSTLTLKCNALLHLQVTFDQLYIPRMWVIQHTHTHTHSH